MSSRSTAGSPTSPATPSYSTTTAAGGDATRHLLDLGHRRIALLVADTHWTSDAGRLKGYVHAHEQLGVAVDERLILRVAFHAPDAEERIATLLEQQRPTAIFAANNTLAEHAWHVLRRLGWRLPEDVSLVGFDDVPWMAMVEPGITAVSQPTLEMGRKAAELLLRRSADRTASRTVETLAATLIVRGSTAAPPAPS